MTIAKTICVVTGSRAEFGLLRPLIQLFHDDTDVSLQVLVTGMHLSEKYGSTWKEIEEAGFEISAKVDTLDSANDASAVARSTAVGISGCADALKKLAPDLMVVLGDRFETFAAAVAATFLKIPIAHFHGGETTEGAFDESLRHSISKMAHLHFVAAEPYRRRVIQLGESPKRVFNVGAVGLDNAHQCEILNRSQLEHATNARFRDRNLMVTFHPVTLENDSHAAARQVEELIAALEQLGDFGIILTCPNADPGSDAVMEKLEQFAAANHERVWKFQSLGFLRYLSALKMVDAVVGNSSSGLIEAPHFRTPTVNIGNRQKGRIAGSTVIQCQPNCADIVSAVNRCCSAEFKKSILDAENPYGVPGASKKAFDVIRSTDLTGILQKRFHDLDVMD